jgi:hypothetical protein
MVKTQNVRPQVPRSLPSSFHYVSPKLAFLMALESLGSQDGDHPQEVLAKFGYKLTRCEILRILVYLDQI